MRSGKVAEVDPKEQWVRLDFGEATGGGKFLSPKIPYAQVAGALKLHSPPSVGQQMSMMAPGGDWQQAVAVPFTWSNDNTSPNDQGDQHQMTFGSADILLKSDSLKMTIGSSVLFMEEEKVTLTVGGNTWTFDANGLEQEGGHTIVNSKHIDEHHTHNDVMPGPSITGPVT